MLAAERRPRDEIFTHREPADDNGLEPDLPNQVRGNRKRILVIAGDRHTDQFALAMGIFAKLHIVDRIEPADDMRPGQQLRRGKTSATLLLNRFYEPFAIASRDRVAYIEHQRLLGEGCCMILADLLHRGVGDNDRHDIAKSDRLLDGSGFSERAEAIDKLLQLI